MTDWRL